MIRRSSLVACLAGNAAHLASSSGVNAAAAMVKLGSGRSDSSLSWATVSA